MSPTRSSILTRRCAQNSFDKSRKFFYNVSGIARGATFDAHARFFLATSTVHPPYILRSPFAFRLRFHGALRSRRDSSDNRDEGHARKSASALEKFVDFVARQRGRSDGLKFSGRHLFNGNQSPRGFFVFACHDCCGFTVCVRV